MRERVPPQTGTATTPPAKQRATGEVPVANGAPKAAPEKAEPAANGALGTGKAIANGDISPGKTIYLHPDIYPPRLFPLIN